MNHVYITQGYRPTLDAYDTQRAIADNKEPFQNALSRPLPLTPCS